MAKKILIIDDETELCEQVTEYLNEAGYLAYYAANGKDGLEMIEKVRPNLLLLDIKMPEMDGLQVMRKIIEKHPNLIVMILTGVRDTETAEKAIEYGACEYLVKPISGGELTQRFIRPLLGE